MKRPMILFSNGVLSKILVDFLRRVERTDLDLNGFDYMIIRSQVGTNSHEVKRAKAMLKEMGVNGSRILMKNVQCFEDIKFSIFNGKFIATLDKIVSGIDVETVYCGFFGGLFTEKIINEFNSGDRRKFKLIAPFVKYTYTQIVGMGNALDTRLESTHSCDESGNINCGVCPKCSRLQISLGIMRYPYTWSPRFRKSLHGLDDEQYFELTNLYDVPYEAQVEFNIEDTHQGEIAEFVNRSGVKWVRIRGTDGDIVPTKLMEKVNKDIDMSIEIGKDDIGILREIMSWPRPPRQVRIHGISATDLFQEMPRDEETKEVDFNVLKCIRPILDLPKDYTFEFMINIADWVMALYREGVRVFELNLDGANPYKALPIIVNTLRELSRYIDQDIIFNTPMDYCLFENRLHNDHFDVFKDYIRRWGHATMQFKHVLWHIPGFHFRCHPVAWPIYIDAKGSVYRCRHAMKSIGTVKESPFFVVEKNRELNCDCRCVSEEKERIARQEEVKREQKVLEEIKRRTIEARKEAADVGPAVETP